MTLAPRDYEEIFSGPWWEDVRRHVGATGVDYPYLAKLILPRSIQPTLDVDHLIPTHWSAVTLTAGEDNLITIALADPQRFFLAIINYSDQDLKVLPVSWGNPTADLGIPLVKNAGQLYVDQGDGAIVNEEWHVFAPAAAVIRVGVKRL